MEYREMSMQLLWSLGGASYNTRVEENYLPKDTKKKQTNTRFPWMQIGR